jgi:hypothetical protein
MLWEREIGDEVFFHTANQKFVILGLRTLVTGDALQRPDQLV